MAGEVLEFNWLTIFMVFVTCFLVANDRAFSKKVRIQFQITLIVSLYLSILSQSLVFFANDSIVYTINFISEIVCRPVIVVLLVNLFVRLKKNYEDYIFAAVVLIISAAAISSEIFLNDRNVVNNTLCVVSCVIYFYCVMQTYKKDNLTKLPLRHNLSYEMEDVKNKNYDVVLIDVDNFKLINDRYGHEAGDAALVAVVEAINKSLVKGCRMYRYGGDEFVIMSQNVDRNILIDSLNKANDMLVDKDLHFSYGISEHNPGDEDSQAIANADAQMYDNKKELKGDGIWDDMTGLYNYRGMLAEIKSFRKIVEADGHTLSLIAIDVDRLNNINMAYGYIEGNLVIRTLAEIFNAAILKRGFAGHIGSDEFVIAMEVNSIEDSEPQDYINRVCDAVAKAEVFCDKDYTVLLNTGTYTVDTNNHVSVEELVNDALYVKQEYKDNKSKTFSEDDDYDANEEKLVMDILDNNRLRYAFQPIVSARDGEIIAYESLMRSDTETMVSPNTIIKYAELNNRSYDIERYTFFNVLYRITNGNDFPPSARIFINSIPGFMLLDEDYNEIRDKYGEWFERMVIEITEQREVDDNALAIINSRRGRDGFNLAIDDYGSGYSNTNSLLRYMPQIIKLDRLLITGIERNAKKQFFVDSIISFAHDNDMLTLAEGVETESELKTVIRLGVDMIQGYYTAKPAFEIIESIPEDIKRVIVEENIRVSGNKRKVYTAAENGDLSSIGLAMENYSKVNISAEHVKIVGNKEYTADLVIRIKEGTNCNLTLSDVMLNSVDDEPCIEIGEGASLTLNLEGNNRLNAKGIHVSEGSSLTVIGIGNLDIFAKGHECYGIGSDSESGFGNITLNSTGVINLTIDGERCMGIGGGCVKEGSAVNVLNGTYNIRIAGVDAVGIGCYEGDMPIVIRDNFINIDFRVNTGTVIGCLNGVQNTDIKNFCIDIVGSGTAVSGVGSINDTSGKISFEAGAYRIKLNGQKLHLLGCSSGALDIKASHVKFEMTGEGDNVIGYGSFDGQSHFKTDECSMELTINASSPLAFGIVEAESEIGFKGPLTIAKINGISNIVGVEE